MRVDLLDSMGSDLTVVNAARVSFDKISSSLTERDIKLIHYLAKHNHWSPFSHTMLQFRVKAPIFVARQLGKHQVGLAWNEVSRRYVDSEPEFYEPKVWRGRPDNVKQGSDGEVEVDNLTYIRSMSELVGYYNGLIAEGVAPEMARMVLPQSTYTEWYWSGSLYSFARVCQLRLDKSSQIEVQEISRQLSAHCSTRFPHSWNALMRGEENETTEGCKRRRNEV